MTAIQRGASPQQPAPMEGRHDLGVEEARQGMTTGHMRWVLVISTVVAAILFIALWFWFPRPSHMTQSPAATMETTAPASAPGPTSSNPAAQ